MSDAVVFQFSAGWCELALGSGAQRRAFRATGIDDAFRHLAQAVAALAHPEPETCLQAVLWGDEPGGVFLDFATVAPDHLALVVHALAIPNWITGTAAQWMPIRGEVLLKQLAPRQELVTAFLHGFTAAGATAGPDGSIAGWPHPYPAAAVTEIRDALGG
ncbi:hypothetical protein NGB36_28230 [Streptomyces sp. RB6PN25]|uniref:Uncharacterized protein n=1 Tax=Streptomyces humicola TaxID=2953240 RepID=A0ABT1Q367_9ACTN|nr:hypothetical protein [Streptomyces humicola]MCQ4084364.1 hypothetical protein [Streptomyces humicola]